MSAEKEVAMSKLIWKLSQVLIVLSVAMSSASLFGCSSTPPPPERSTSEVKSDADRTFENVVPRLKCGQV